MATNNTSTKQNKANTPSVSQQVHENQFVLQQYDKAYAKAIIEKLGNICHDTYFRSLFVGFDSLPVRKRAHVPSIYISNHSGMAFPWDAMVLNSLHNYKLNFGRGSFRPLVAPVLSATALMNPFMIPNFWKKTGGIDASFLNFETLMQQEEYEVMLYPEGIPGIGKGFNKAYQLQKFHTSCVRMAVKYKTDLHWISTLNGEYVNPYSYSWPWINRWSQKIGISFLPLSPLLLLVPFQPWLFYFSFPARLRYVLGPTIKAYEMVDKPYEAISQEEFRALADKIRLTCQKHLSDTEKTYGRPHYHWTELFARMWKNRQYFPFYLPFMWPIIYGDFDKQSQQQPDFEFEIDFSFKGILNMLWRNPIAIAYFIPILGWIPLAIQGYRGHRLARHKR